MRHRSMRRASHVGQVRACSACTQALPCQPSASFEVQPGSGVHLCLLQLLVQATYKDRTHGSCRGPFAVAADTRLSTISGLSGAASWHVRCAP